MDELNYFCNDKKIHQDLAVRLRTYFSQTQHLLRAKRYDTLMDKMSNRLRGDTADRRLRATPPPRWTRDMTFSE